MLALALAAAGASGLPAARAADAAGQAAPSDQDLASQACAIGEEKFLPADYYYCLGGQAYGQGHYERAQKFFATAAGWASKPAQYVLGVMALHGDHQPADRPLALAWLSLAAERRQADFAAAAQQAYAAATPAERLAADALLAKMRPVYGDAVAAPRAEQRYRDNMARLARQGNGGDVQCIAGAAPPGRNVSGNSTVACLHLTEMTVALDRTAARVFDGWNGHVAVGALQPGEAPAGASTRQP
jgi:hypothetical protein